MTTEIPASITAPHDGTGAVDVNPHELEHAIVNLARGHSALELVNACLRVALAFWAMGTGHLTDGQFEAECDDFAESFRLSLRGTRHVK